MGNRNEISRACLHAYFKRLIFVCFATVFIYIVVFWV
jgi:hypothetical protein